MPRRPRPFFRTAALCATILGLALAVGAGGTGASATAATPNEASPSAERPITTRAELEAAVPGSENPYLHFLPPGVVPDHRYWSARVRFDSWDRAAADPSPSARGSVSETEDNDTFADADPLAGLVAGGGSISISGTTDSPPVFFPPVTSGQESGACVNESFGSATPLSLVDGARLEVQAAIGDCVLANADVDTYEFFLAPGDTIAVDIDAGGSPDTYAFLFGESPYSLLDVAFSDPFASPFDPDPYVSATAPAFGTYWVQIGSSSGTGNYTAFIGKNVALDVFSVELEAGDVLSVTSNLVSELGIVGPGPPYVERFGSALPSSDLLPATSPLLRTATGSEVHDVARESGTHYIRLRSLEPFPEPYTLQAQVFRPGTDDGDRQTIFVDFDGATIDADELFESGPEYSNATLSPLSDFLAGWGLSAGSQSAVITSILEVIEENLADLVATNPLLSFEVLNSRDHADPFGQPGVSRMIIGGTREQIGRETIGVASHIDPGNFDLEDTAVVLLDLLSGPSESTGSLNQFTLSGITKIDLVGLGVGNIASHEIGHFLGVWHTDSQNATHALVDGGGMLSNILGSEDDVIGDFDDEDVDFLDDVYTAGSLFRGLEDQAARVAYALTGSAAIFSDGFESGDTTAWN